MTVPFAELIALVSEQVLLQGGSARFAVSGDSMYPFLRSGDVVEVAAPTGRGVRVGDLALVKRDDGGYVLHRICRVAPGGVWLLGDAQARAEGPFAQEQVIGVVREVWRGGAPLCLASRRSRVTARAWVLLRPVRGPLLAGARRLRCALRRLWKRESAGDIR